LRFQEEWAFPYEKERIIEWSAGERILRTRCYGHHKVELVDLFRQCGFNLIQIWENHTPLESFSQFAGDCLLFRRRSE
jgi:hypothetical protein